MHRALRGAAAAHARALGDRRGRRGERRTAERPGAAAPGRDGRAPDPATDATPPLLWAGAVTPAYFRLMGIPLVRGPQLRGGRRRAERAGRARERVTARRYWPDQDPIGKRIRVMWDMDWRRVVGVVGDVRQFELSGRSPDVITGALYMPYPQAVALDRQMPKVMTLFARSSSELPRSRSGCAACRERESGRAGGRGAADADGGAVVGRGAALDDVALRLLRGVRAAARRDRDLRRHLLRDGAARVRDRGADGDRGHAPRDLRPRDRRAACVWCSSVSGSASWPRSCSAGRSRASSTASRRRTR